MSRFWDTSAIIPLLVREPATEDMRALVRTDRRMVVWWGTHVECVSALSRRTRESGRTPSEEMPAREALREFSEAWTEVESGSNLRTLAERLLVAHALRAADALQLAAALIWGQEMTEPRELVCLDTRLRNAAQSEGFAVHPE